MLVQACVAPNVDKEHCILAQCRTTKLQIELMKNHLMYYENREEFPVSWKIEVADQFNGWFPGIALHFNPLAETVHVKILNMNKKPNDYVYDGYVPIDHRIVRLVACEDHYSHALFNYIIRKSVISIKWDLLWYRKENQEIGKIIRSREETATHSSPLTESIIRRQVNALSTSITSMGVYATASDEASMVIDEHFNEWHRYTARYYIASLNMLIIEIPCITGSLHSAATGRRNSSTSYPRAHAAQLQEPEHNNISSSVAHYVVVKLEEHLLKLHYCHYLVGMNDFERLILEETVPCTSAARDQMRSYYQQIPPESSPQILTQPRTSTTATAVRLPSDPRYQSSYRSASGSSSLDTVEEEWSSLSLRCESKESNLTMSSNTSRTTTSLPSVSPPAQTASRSSSRLHRRRHAANNLVPLPPMNNHHYIPSTDPNCHDWKSCTVSKSMVTNPTPLCVICLEKPISNIAFIPCGHQIVCQSCFDFSFASSVLVKKANPSASNPSTPVSTTSASSAANRKAAVLCPLCRSSVQNILKVFKG
jgi:hypothetical protein